MWVRRVFTVRGETKSRVAMSLFASPSLTSRTTSRSVGVSAAQPLARRLRFALDESCVVGSPRRCGASTTGLDCADMEPHWPPFRGPTARRVWQEALRPVAAEMQACAPQLAGRIVELYESELPTVVPDASAVAEQLASVEASVRLIAQCIETGEDPRRVDLAPATTAISRSGAQRDIPLKDLIRSVRLGQQQLWQWLFDRISATREPGERDRALELVTNWLFSYIDGFLARGEHAYEIEREAWLGGAAATRAAAVHDILTGREDDPQRASKRLRYDINRHHIGVSTWLKTTRDDPDAQTALTAALAQLTRAVSGQSTLVHPAGSMAIAG